MKNTTQDTENQSFIPFSSEVERLFIIEGRKPKKEWIRTRKNLFSVNATSSRITHAVIRRLNDDGMTCDQLETLGKAGALGAGAGKRLSIPSPASIKKAKAKKKLTHEELQDVAQTVNFHFLKYPKRAHLLEVSFLSEKERERASEIKKKFVYNIFSDVRRMLEINNTKGDASKRISLETKISEEQSISDILDASKNAMFSTTHRDDGKEAISNLYKLVREMRERAFLVYSKDTSRQKLHKLKKALSMTTWIWCNGYTGSKLKCPVIDRKRGDDSTFRKAMQHFRDYMLHGKEIKSFQDADFLEALS
jgi:hypothetical protein